MYQFQIFYIVLLLAECQLAYCKPPHILLIVADDYGWNDIGYHGSEIKTPTLDALAAEGVKLNNYYVQPICTPTRSQLLSGRYQIHTGLQHGVIQPTIPNALPKEIPTLADKLHQVGYSTHMVGKWHLGFYKSEYLPTNRGFNTFYGYLEGAEDYYNHRRCFGGFCGLDFRDNLKPVVDENGTYSAQVFSERVKDIVEQHVTSDSDKPLFMYVPFQSVHAPLEVPERYTQKYSFIKSAIRRMYAGMVSALDEAVQNITESFKKYGLWEDTLLVFSTDNGGRPNAGGNNYPLRGQKDTLWEGGVRGVGFVRGAQIEKPGRTSNQLMHVSDWFPTLVSLAGGNTTGLQLDGYDIWPAVSNDTSSPRRELLHNIDPLYRPRGKRLHPKLFDTRVRAAIRVGDWKLLTGDPGVSHDKHVKPPPEDLLNSTLYFNPDVRNILPPKQLMNDFVSKDELGHVFDKDPSNKDNLVESFDEDTDKNIWLYNIKNDPNKYIDLSEKYPSLVMNLLEKLTKYNATAVPCRFPPSDPNADPGKHGGVWGPWEE